MSNTFSRSYHNKNSINSDIITHIKNSADNVDGNDWHTW